MLQRAGCFSIGLVVSVLPGGAFLRNNPRIRVPGNAGKVGIRHGGLCSLAWSEPVPGWEFQRLSRRTFSLDGPALHGQFREEVRIQRDAARLDLSLRTLGDTLDGFVAGNELAHNLAFRSRRSV